MPCIYGYLRDGGEEGHKPGEPEAGLDEEGPDVAAVGAVADTQGGTDPAVEHSPAVQEHHVSLYKKESVALKPQPQFYPTTTTNPAQSFPTTSNISPTEGIKPMILFLFSLYF
jgi:hypothetical protein